MHTVSEAATLLGVCPKTIRRWCNQGMMACTRTLGGHRRIAPEEIQRIIAGKKEQYQQKPRGVAIYTRVSSHEQKQKGDLQRQEERLRIYAQSLNLSVDYSLSDVASGLNATRQGLQQLFKLVCKGKISQVLVTFKDRLTRFGFEYLSFFFSCYGVQIVVLAEDEEKSPQEEMVDDLVAIVTSFSGKIHGMRSHQNSKQKNRIAPIQLNQEIPNFHRI